jgi:hypothetical protein
MRNPSGPREKLPLFTIAIFVNCAYHLKESLLEDVLGKELVLYQKEDGGVNLILMPIDKRFQRRCMSL